MKTSSSRFKKSLYFRLALSVWFLILQIKTNLRNLFYGVAASIHKKLDRRDFGTLLSKPSKPRNLVAYTALALLSGSLSCLTSPQNLELNSTPTPASSTNIITSWINKLSHPTPTYIPTYQRLKNGDLAILGSVDDSLCSAIDEHKYPAAQVWLLPIHSLVGSLQATVHISAGNTVSDSKRIDSPPGSTKDSATVTTATNPLAPAPDVVEITIGSWNITIAPRETPSLDVLKHICEQQESSEKYPVIVDDSKFADTLKSWLTAMSPACQFDAVTEKGWGCLLSPTSARHTSHQYLKKQIKNLAKMQRQIIQKWSRQPYLFTRKLVITRKLASALRRKNPRESINIFCQIIKNSLTSELPLSVSNKIWQDSACNLETADSNVKLLASSALRDAIMEVEALFELVERNSRLGVVQLKIPRNLAPSKNLWVSLSPDTSEGSMLDPTTSRKEASEGRQGCWHPIYSSNDSLFDLAQTLDIVSPANLDSTKKLATKSSCRITTNPSEQNSQAYPKPAKWIADSITGETEFIVTNGNAKILRLPKGIYKYKIHGLPENATQWKPSDSDPKTSGTINWTARRPSNVIRTW